jgi:hypothetical protein
MCVLLVVVKLLHEYRYDRRTVYRRTDENKKFGKSIRRSFTATITTLSRFPFYNIFIYIYIYIHTITPLVETSAFSITLATIYIAAIHI